MSASNLSEGVSSSTGQMNSPNLRKRTQQRSESGLRKARAKKERRDLDKTIKLALGGGIPLDELEGHRKKFKALEDNIVSMIGKYPPPAGLSSDAIADILEKNFKQIWNTISRSIKIGDRLEAFKSMVENQGKRIFYTQIDMNTILPVKENVTGEDTPMERALKAVTEYGKTTKTLFNTD